MKSTRGERQWLYKTLFDLGGGCVSRDIPRIRTQWAPRNNVTLFTIIARNLWTCESTKKIQKLKRLELFIVNKVVILIELYCSLITAYMISYVLLLVIYV